MNGFINGKKADERYLSIWMFFNWFIIGGAIVLGVVIFLSAQTYSKEIETSFFYEKISDCLSKDFNLQEIKADNFDLEAKCGLNKKVIEGGNYLITLNIAEVNSGVVSSELSVSKTIGDTNFKVLCGLTQSQKNLPRCKSSSLRLTDAGTGKLYAVGIFTAVNQA